MNCFWYNRLFLFIRIFIFLNYNNNHILTILNIYYIISIAINILKWTNIIKHIKLTEIEPFILHKSLINIMAKGHIY